MAAITISAPLVFASLFFALSSKRLQPLMESSVNPFYTPEKVYQPKSEFKPNTAKIDIAKTETPVETDNGLMYFKLENTDKIIIASATDNNLTLPKANTKLNIKTQVENFSSDAPFQVVVGCFSVEENANRLIRDLQKNNISAAISIVNAKGLHVVSCGSFISKEQAVNKLEEIKGNFPSAWIMAK
jgi:cell division septation protein DedD